MDISTYRPLISKVLSRCSGKGMSPDQVASAICERITSFEEDMALMGGTQKALIIQGPTQQPSDIFTDKQDGPYAAPRVDISERIGAEEEVGLIERYTKEQLVEFSKNQMPSTLLVKPPEYDKAFEINKFVQSAPGDLGFVNIIYQPAGGQVIDGQPLGPTVRISTTDKILDGDALTDSIRKQADSLYTKNKKVLTPKMPNLGNGPGDLRGALSAEAPGTGEEGLTMASVSQTKMTLPESLSQQWKAQRR